MYNCFSFAFTEADIVTASFFGNTTDYYKILDHDDESILVGAK